MGAFGIQFGNKTMLKDKPIGKILVYPLTMVSSKGGHNVYDLDKESKCEEYEVVKVVDHNNTKFYLTNQWNESFEDVQAFSEDFIKEYIKY